jgi:hypothetical protein
MDQKIDAATQHARPAAITDHRREGHGSTAGYGKAASTNSTKAKINSNKCRFAITSPSKAQPTRQEEHDENEQDDP